MRYTSTGRCPFVMTMGFGLTALLTLQCQGLFAEELKAAQSLPPRLNIVIIFTDDQGNGVRQGQWKYLKAKHDVPGYVRDRQRPIIEELYDLECDIGETRNLAEKYPEKVAELKALMNVIATGTR